MAGITTNLHARWPGGKMPYAFSVELQQKHNAQLKAIIDAAVTKWNGYFNNPPANPPVALVQHHLEPDFLLFTINPVPNMGGPTTATALSCASQFNGRHGGPQLLFCSTAQQPSAGDIMHEICHAFGLYHEQNRWDRNDHVVIHWDNIPPAEWSQFMQDPIGSKDQGSYDFASIMHYDLKAYAIDRNRQTITPVDPLPPGTPPWPRTDLSAGDIAGILSLRPITITPPSLTIAPPPITVTPPAVQVAPPSITVNPPPITVTPASVTILGRTVQPPSITVNPPSVTVTPPPITVNPAPITVTPPPITITPPPVTL